MHWPGACDALVPPMLVVEAFELAQGMEQVALVSDQRPIQQLASAGLHPPLHDRLTWADAQLIDRRSSHLRGAVWAQTVLMALHLVYFAVIRLFSWPMLLARSEASKDA